MFAMELMMHEVNAKTLVPVVISTVTATYVSQVFLGTHPSFVIPAFERPYFHLESPWALFLYAILGLIMGVVSTVFIKSIYASEDFFDRHVKGGYYVRHMTGMLIVGIIIYLVMNNYGHYHVEGVGYATVNDVLSGTDSVMSLLLLLFILKLLVTSLTLGSGGSGGIFSPSLYLGATLGGAYGLLLERMFPGLAIDPAAFAVAGMAGVVGGATGAVTTAIVMIFEMTLNYNVIIPITLTTALSFGARKLLISESIYTMKLARKNHRTPESMEKIVLREKTAKDIMETSIGMLPVSASRADCERIARESTGNYFLVPERERIVGILQRSDLEKSLEQNQVPGKLTEIMTTDYIEVPEDDPVLDVIARMNSAKVYFVIVKSDKEIASTRNIRGLITGQEICDSVTACTAIFSH